MLGLDERSQIGLDVYQRLGVPVPRDGGLNDLLEAVERGERPGERVGCERISRVAREMLASLTVEHYLESKGIPSCAPTNPRAGRPPGD
ncbi:recombinase family protein [Actinomadura citrea]|uniref:hypothetical protein n=1 Tax=Actinomadura citrea TaxID=46158 RepID=UPI002E282916|nr:hypothetical protein [Actinomadura citrea]